MGLRNFSFPQNAQPGSETRRTPNSMGDGTVSSEIELTKLESDNSSLCCVEVEKEWKYLHCPSMHSW